MSHLSRRSTSTLALIWLSAAALLGCAVEPESGAFDVEGGEFSVRTTTTTATTSPASQPERSLCGQITLPTTLFETGSASLTAKAGEELLEALDGQLASACVGEGELTCSDGAVVADVVGHTDSEPHIGAGGNQELSKQRAQTVADLLALRNIDSNVSGVADRDQISTTDPRQNRRVVVTFTCEA